MYLWNYHHNQGKKDFAHSQTFLMPFYNHPLSSHLSTLVWFLSLQLSLYVLEFYVSEIREHVLFSFSFCKVYIT